MRLSSAANYTVRTLDAHDGHPYRIYVDLDGTTLDNRTHPQRGLSTGPVMRIRTGQFTPSQARVVLDLKHPAPHAITVRRKPFRIIVSVDDPLPAEDPSPSALESPTTVAAVTPEPEPRLEQPRTVQANASADPPTEGQSQQLNELNAPQRKSLDALNESQTAERQISPDDAPSAPLWNVSPAHILTGPAFAAPLRIVIDPGHGGRDPGARSVDGAWEKNVALEVAHELAHRLRERLGAEVVLTREGDQTLSIAERALYAEHASLFLSIHANTCPEQWVGGVQTFYADDAANGPASRRLARLVHHRVVDAIAGGYGPVHDGGIRPRELGVLVRSAAPSVLLEAAYLSTGSGRGRSGRWHRRLPERGSQASVGHGSAPVTASCGGSTTAAERRVPVADMTCPGCGGTAPGLQSKNLIVARDAACIAARDPPGMRLDVEHVPVDEGLRKAELIRVGTGLL
jgi:N-acetylmuramoyl-L-alanine amidase